MNHAPILLVEDDANDVFFFQRAVRKAAPDRSVQVSSDGQQALAYLTGEGKYADREKHPLPCMLVLDLHMPKKNGFELLEWLRRTPPLKKLPVVILSSSQAEKDIQRCLTLGARAYHVKPTDPGKIVDLVGLMLTECLGVDAPG